MEVQKLILTVIIIVTYTLLPIDAFSQRSVSSFGEREDFYSFKAYVGPSRVDISVTVGNDIYNLKAEENFGTGSEKKDLWTELVVYHDDNRYDFRASKRGPSSSQIGMFEVGKTYKMGSESYPFTMLANLVSKDGSSGIVKVSIIPEGGVQSCSKRMPLKLRFRSTSYLMCKDSENPVLLKFEHRSSYRGRMDYPGYQVSSKEGGEFEKVGGFSATRSSRSITVGSTAFKMRRTQRMRSGEYGDYGSEWIVTAE